MLRRALRKVWRKMGGSQPDEFLAVRRPLAFHYLQGTGLEIGALHQPLDLPKSARVRYVDRMTDRELREHYPDLANRKLVPIDVVDNGETLTTVADDSQDFVIANHFLEHTEDPIGSLKTFFRVLKPGGVLYLALPDKQYTFDQDRPVTPFDHLVADHSEGPARSRDEHYLEYARLVHHCKTDEETRGVATHLRETGFSIHFHVWTQSEMIEMLTRLRETLRFDWEVVRRNGMEMIFILRKTSSLSMAA